ncbi:amidase domain-containing protein [Bacillus sp. FJAT-52991]|uniref:Amidase domain-containing protein n=1 Tax=Bacillus kandeliae TaxID=3129297 RepID=A0ABZ2NB57_9BACI
MKKFLTAAAVFTMFVSAQGSVVMGAENEANQNKVKVIQIEDIDTYKTLPNGKIKEKGNALVKHKDAIKIINTYMKQNDINLKTDLDDPSYQEFVMSLGTQFESFNDEDMAKVVDFVKFMDVYENYDKNKKIGKFEDKLENNSELSEQETIELNELLPISPDADYTVEDPTVTDDSPATVTLAEDPYTEEGEEPEDASQAAANGYNKIKARDYAYKWWDGRNPMYDYYAAKKGCTVKQESCWNDCANFVSQALYNGGMKMKYGPSYTSTTSWNYGVVPAYSWGGAHNFYLHWKGRAGIAKYTSWLQTGDAINADYTKDGDIEHTAIITKNYGSAANQKYLTQHTEDKKELSTVKTWLNAGYRIYGYEIDKAKN